MSKNVKNNPYKMESLERRYMMDGNQWSDELQTADYNVVESASLGVAA